jgi:hypothetical protein
VKPAIDHCGSKGSFLGIGLPSVDVTVALTMEHKDITALIDVVSVVVSTIPDRQCSPLESQAPVKVLPAGIDTSLLSCDPVIPGARQISITPADPAKTVHEAVIKPRARRIFFTVIS